MIKLAFVYDVDVDYWQDGLWSAIDIIRQTKLYQVYPVNIREAVFPDINFDFVLVWGALGSKQVNLVKNLPNKKGICVAGGPINHPDVHAFDVVFAETSWHVREFRKIGVDAKLAFGTNTSLFKPYNNISKIWDRIYPAAFALWKRHDLFCAKPGKKLAVGYIQPNNHEKECWEICLHCGVSVLPMVTPNVLVWLYNSAKVVSVTADLFGGGERAVLEGLACGLEVEVEQDNEKLVELLAEQKKHLSTEVDYAQALKEGIEECLK
jgi:hypothetical protein